MSRITDVWRKQEDAAGVAAPEVPFGVALARPGADANTAAYAPSLGEYAAELNVAAELGERPSPTPVVPTARPERQRGFGTEAVARKLVVGGGVPGVCIEQYRRLAVALHQLQIEQGLRVLMVASTAPREGKTLTITNLALTLSESFQQRVLLIDADLRRASVHEVLGVPNQRGLAEALRAGTSSGTEIELSSHLSVLPAGPAVENPLGILTSEHLRSLVNDAATRFDWVLFDTPPIGILPDAQPIARICDGVLFVIAAGVTPYAEVQKAIAELGAERIVGTVLNQVDDWVLAGKKYSGHYY